MKNLLIAALLVPLSAMAAPENANYRHLKQTASDESLSPMERCASLSEIVMLVAEGRSRGVPQHEMEQRVAATDTDPEDPYLRLVRRTYELHHLVVDTMPHELANEMYQDCLKSLEG